MNATLDSYINCLLKGEDRGALREIQDGEGHQ
jgi:hypothetical protein